VIRARSSKSRRATRATPSSCDRHKIVNAGAGDDFVGPGYTVVADVTQRMEEDMRVRQKGLQRRWIDRPDDDCVAGHRSFINGGLGNDTLLAPGIKTRSRAVPATMCSMAPPAPTPTPFFRAATKAGISSTTRLPRPDAANHISDFWTDYGGAVVHTTVTGAQDTVAFQRGVTAAALQFGWRRATEAGGQWVLDISWRNEAGISVSCVCEDRRQVSALNVYLRRRTRLSMDELLARAPARPAEGTTGNDVLTGDSSAKRARRSPRRHHDGRAATMFTSSTTLLTSSSKKPMAAWTLCAPA